MAESHEYSHEFNSTFIVEIIQCTLKFDHWNQLKILILAMHFANTRLLFSNLNLSSEKFKYLFEVLCLVLLIKSVGIKTCSALRMLLLADAIVGVILLKMQLQSLLKSLAKRYEPFCQVLRYCC